MPCQHLLHIVYIYRFIELFYDAWFFFARYPNFQFGVEVEGSGGFDAKTGDAFVGYGFVLGFAAGKALHIHEYKAFAGKDKRVSDQLKAQPDRFSFGKQLTVLFDSFFLACRARVARQC